MKLLNNQHRILTIILFSSIYLTAGLIFANLANSSDINKMRITWRVTAFVISGAAFAAHIWFEHFRQKNTPLSTAFRTSIAAALGAFALAVAANFHLLGASPGYHPSLVLALVLWPVGSAVIAFIAALAVSGILKLIRQGTKPSS